jgi:phage gp29-like protein
MQTVPAWQLPTGPRSGDAPPVYGPGVPPAAAVHPPRKGPKDFVVYHDNAIPLWTQWDVGTATAALDNHVLGQFYQSALLADAMGIDDALDAVVQTRVLGLISRPFELRRSRKGNGHKSRIALRVIKERWDEIFPEDVLVALMRQYLMLGFSAAQQVWRYDEKLIVPHVQVWPIAHFYYDWPTRSYVANTMEGPVHIRPGDGRWVLLTPFGAYRGWLHGAVRAVVIPFLCRQYALRDWARYNEVHGLPIKKVYAPESANADDKQTFLQAVANMGNEAAVLIPRGVGDRDSRESYDLDLLEAKADTYAAFKDITTKCEERMAIRLLGQNLTTNVDAGSLAAANVHDRVRLDYTRFDAKALGALREQVLRAFCQFNYGDPDVAPEMAWDCTPPEDKSAKAKAVLDLSTALVNLASMKAPVDLRKALDTAGLPLVEPSEDAPNTPEIQPAPADAA